MYHKSAKKRAAAVIFNSFTLICDFCSDDFIKNFMQLYSVFITKKKMSVELSARRGSLTLWWLAHGAYVHRQIPVSQSRPRGCFQTLVIHWGSWHERFWGIALCFSAAAHSLEVFWSVSTERCRICESSEESPVVFKYPPTLASHSVMYKITHKCGWKYKNDSFTSACMWPNKVLLIRWLYRPPREELPSDAETFYSF